MGWADGVGRLRQQDDGANSGETCSSSVAVKNVTSAGKRVVLKV